MPSGEASTQTLTINLLPPIAEPDVLTEVVQLPVTETVQILGERALTVNTLPATPVTEVMPAEAPTEIPKQSIRPKIEESGYEHPLMTPRQDTLSPQLRLEMARRRYEGTQGADSAQNRLDQQRRNTRRVQQGLETYSAVTALLGGYVRGFRR